MSFKTQKEIFSALLDGKKIKYGGWIKGTYVHFVEERIVDEAERPYESPFLRPDLWSLYEEPKKMKTVTLYRYTYQEMGHVFQTPWRSMPFDSNLKLLKTESKTTEIEDV